MQMKHMLKKKLPDWILLIYYYLKKKYHGTKIFILKFKGGKLDLKNIKDALYKEEIKYNTILMVHSSLKSLGYVNGGANTIIQALTESVGNEGTLCMPAFPAIGYNYDYLLTSPVFDIKNTPSKMGVITEEFRKMPGVFRSFHPTDSVCAFGKYAAHLTSDHFNQLTPYNQHSPFNKLVELKGKILLLGVNLEVVTNFHLIEDAIPDFKYPVYSDNIFDVKMVNEKGQIHYMKTKSHNPDYSKLRSCNDFEKVFIENNILKVFYIHKTKCAIIDAYKMHHFLVDCYHKGITIYDTRKLVS